jgi:hypothetical protein
MPDYASTTFYTTRAATTTRSTTTVGPKTTKTTTQPTIKGTTTTTTKADGVEAATKAPSYYNDAPSSNCPPLMNATWWGCFNDGKACGLKTCGTTLRKTFCRLKKVKIGGKSNILLIFRANGSGQARQ